MFVKSVGKLRYSPQLLGADSVSESWWLVVDCDPDIGAYYRALYRLQHHDCRKLLRPAWREHISVIRNEEPPEDRKYLWKKYDGQQVEFTFRQGVRTEGFYFWLDVDCDEVLNIREELGLPRDPEFPLHLTIGNATLLEG